MNAPRENIAVIIPCYRVERHIADVLSAIPVEVQQIIVVDDACPNNSGRVALEAFQDNRLIVIRLDENQGVGGATLAGMQIAISKGATLLVKLDGDGQHDPADVNRIVQPLLEGKADYCKGNRFFHVQTLKNMPVLRLFGNSVLSFLSKMSSGYWTLMDPTNGFFAIRSVIIPHLLPAKVEKRYIFESDLLFRLSTLRARVCEVPIHTVYGDEESGVKPSRMIWPFLRWHTSRTWKRIVYNHFLRGFSLASLFLFFGTIMLALGIVAGLGYWIYFISINQSAPAGTVMLVGLLLIFGLNFLLNFVSYDMSAEPKDTIWRNLIDTPSDGDVAFNATYTFISRDGYE